MRITKASLDAVRYACKNYHYSKTVPVYQYAYNIYNDNNEWCGCILFGLGANNMMSNFLYCISGTCLELQRVALNGKQGHNATSKAVSMAMRELKKDAVCLKCLFSYADKEQNHIGIVYQATNWIYIGLSKSDGMYEKDGKIYHRKTISSLLKNRGLCGKQKELGYNYVFVKGKYLYVYPFDKKIKKLLLKKSLPYPKRCIKHD